MKTTSVLEKIAAAHEAGTLCDYCAIRNRCTGGTPLTPNGLAFPPCIDTDFIEFFDEKQYDSDIAKWEADNPDVCVGCGARIPRQRLACDKCWGAYNSAPPCKGCDRRTVTCHSNCKEYQDWQLLRNKLKEAIYKRSKLSYTRYK